MTKLAPQRIVSLMMGVWFLGASVGNYAAGNMAGFYETWPLPKLLTLSGLFAAAAGIGMVLISPWMKRLMGEVK
jgi:POT family proton-dependent oligopeptide transporter